MEANRFQPLTKEDSFEIQQLFMQIRESFRGRPDELIPVLQKAQKTLGYLPENVLLEIARFTKLSAATVFGVATFYEQFRFHPIGKHTVRVCRGTACHVRGSHKILDEIENRLHLAPGETSEDRLFTLETVACFGSCALAPVVLVDDTVKGRMNPSDTVKTLEKIKKESEKS